MQQKRRANIEGRISILVRQFMGAPPRAKGFEHRANILGWAVLTHNLWKLARLEQAEQNRPQLGCQHTTDWNRYKQQFQEASCIDISNNAEKPASSPRNHALPKLYPQNASIKAFLFAPLKLQKKKHYLGQALFNLLRPVVSFDFHLILNLPE